MYYRLPLIALIAHALVVWSGSAVAAQRGPLSDLDGYVRAAMREWQVPGLAIAVVKNDSIVMARGYGVRQLGRPEAVDEHTVFAAASTTKAMTATALGMLVDEGRLHWDDPVIRHLRDFQLFDESATGEVTIRDLLAHRSGLPRGDLLWWASPYSRAEVVQRVRHLRPTSPPRTRFGYNNIMYVAAGEILEAASGATWDDFIADRLFAPLGMTRSSTSAHEAAGSGNTAIPHLRIDGRIRPIAWRSVDNLGAAGAVNSSAWDMAQWIRFNLRGGQAGERRLVSDSVTRITRTPHVDVRVDSSTDRLHPRVTNRAYGLGWALQDYHGYRVLHHDGALDGMRTQVMMIPDLQLGVVVFTNFAPASLHVALAYRIIDDLIGAPSRDWSGELLAATRLRQLQRDREWKDYERARVTGTRPSLEPSRYAGVYADSMYGRMTVEENEGALVVRFGDAWEGDLEHWHFDTFRVIWRDSSLGRTSLTFVLGANRAVRSMSIHEFGEFGRAAGSR
jgi:CubicO group peptidase (beta-lactamase class C family)